MIVVLVPIVLIAVFCFGKSSKVDTAASAKKTEDENNAENADEPDAEDPEEEETEEADAEVTESKQKAPVSKSDLEEAQPEQEQVNFLEKQIDRWLKKKIFNIFNFFKKIK